MANIGHQLLNVPIGDLVFDLAKAIAESQYKLDKASIEVAKLMSEDEIELPAIGKNEEKLTTTLLGAGFQPTFYQFTETIIEVKIAITTKKTREFKASVTTTTNTKASYMFASVSVATSVNAAYSNKYSYSVDGSSYIRTKLMPKPPNAFLQEYLDVSIGIRQVDLKKKLAKKHKELEDKETKKSNES